MRFAKHGNYQLGIVEISKLYIIVMFVIQPIERCQFFCQFKMYLRAVLYYQGRIWDIANMLALKQLRYSLQAMILVYILFAVNQVSQYLFGGV